VGVEKLLPAKFAKIKSRQEALQTTFSIFLDIFYPPNLGCFEENGLFQQPRDFASDSLETSPDSLFGSGERGAVSPSVATPQHRLYFLPEPLGHGSFRSGSCQNFNPHSGPLP
jgi:hypothetical protein